MLGDTRASIRHRLPRCYLVCCLCANRELLREEKQHYQTSEDNLKKVMEINETIACRQPINNELVL